MVEMVDQQTGRTITEFIDADIVNDMAIQGMDSHEMQEMCELEPVFDSYGNKIGEKTVCEAKDTPTQDCELVPIIDYQTGNVIDVKTQCDGMEGQQPAAQDQSKSQPEPTFGPALPPSIQQQPPLKQEDQFFNSELPSFDFGW